jgi:uncharacterized membrane protein
MPDTRRQLHADDAPSGVLGRPRRSFGEDFRRFFTRGLAALLPTLITLSIIFWVLNFLWEALGQHIVWVIRRVWWQAGQVGLVDERPARQIYRALSENDLGTRVLGIGLAVVLVYIVGLLVGNLIGRTFWALAERAVMKIPVIRAIYPAVKQVTDFVLEERKANFQASRVVAVRMHERDCWSIGFVTGPAPKLVSAASEDETVSVFMPSSPASFSGYIVLAPRKSLVELPWTVEEAMRMLMSGGVVSPELKPSLPGSGRGTASVTLPAPPRADASLMDDSIAERPAGA